MKIAVLGCGTVGGGVVNILREGVDGLNLVKILDKKDRFNPEFIELYTDDPEEIFGDETIDTVVETMGGHDFSYYCIKRALEASKNVVTANKEVIALHLKELSELACEKNVYLMYEASVGGGIPILKTMSNLAKVNDTLSISGILNGTTNYVLTKMQLEDMSYPEALKEAQKKGFAEADPTADVEGLDMLRKIAILAMILYKQEVSIEDIYHFGITGVSKEFIKFVNEKGYTLKFMCFAENREDSIDVGVEPVLVKTGGSVAGVSYETNIVKTVMQPNDELMFIGKGAGRMPTATAIVADIVTIRDGGEKMEFSNKYRKKVGLSNTVVSAVVDDGSQIKYIEKINSADLRGAGYKFYARVMER